MCKNQLQRIRISPRNDTGCETSSKQKKSCAFPGYELFEKLKRPPCGALRLVKLCRSHSALDLLSPRLWDLNVERQTVRVQRGVAEKESVSAYYNTDTHKRLQKQYPAVHREALEWLLDAFQGSVSCVEQYLKQRGWVSCQERIVKSVQRSSLPRSRSSSRLYSISGSSGDLCTPRQPELFTECRKKEEKRNYRLIAHKARRLGSRILQTRARHRSHPRSFQYHLNPLN